MKKKLAVVKNKKNIFLLFLLLPVIYYSFIFGMYSFFMVFNLPYFSPDSILNPIIFFVKLLLGIFMFFSCLITPATMFYVLYNTLVEFFKVISFDLKKFKNA